MSVEVSRGIQNQWKTCLQACDHESCTAAKSIANINHTYVVTAWGGKTTENKMIYLSMVSWET